MSFIPQNEQRKEIICPVCQTIAHVHPLAKTCSLRCTQKQARERRKAREGGFGALAPTASLVDNRVLETLVNPTLEDLLTKAPALASFGDAEKVFVLKGTVPVVENTPIGIATVIKDLKGEWLLIKI